MAEPIARKFPKSRLYALALGTLLIFIIQGCSRIDILYGNLDWLAARWTNDLLDPERAQAKLWRTRIQGTIDQHKELLLPELADLLQQLERQATRGLRAHELQCWMQAVEDSYGRHAKLVIPTAASILSNINENQIQHFSEELEERNEQYQREYLDVDLIEKSNARFERYLDRIERWTGDLSTSQQAMLRQQIDRMPDLTADWLQYRQQRQALLLAMLRQSASDAELSRFLSAWWVEYLGRPADMTAATGKMRRQFIALALSLDSTLSAEQRKTFVENIRSWRTSFAKLAGQNVTVLKHQARVSSCHQATGSS